MNKKQILLFFILFFISNDFFAQTKKYIIYFNDKNNSPYSVSNPSAYLSPRAIQRRQNQHISISTNDLPVNPNYLDSVTAKGVQVLYALKWLNAAVVIADSLQMLSIDSLSMVTSYTRVFRKMAIKNYCTSNTLSNNKNNTQTMLSYGNSYNQVHMLQADAMHSDGYTGEGIWMALLDAGFNNAPNVGFLNQVFASNRILATYDFVNMEVNVYNDDVHGLEVLSTIAGYLEGALIGTAFNTSFILLKTEDTNSENEVEEANWARGAEYADSMGADIISSSLGYTTFDLKSDSHTYQDMNGTTTIAARAANAAFSKGILVFCSAGNDGGDSWHYISTPADGLDVLAVGAVDANEKYAYFSSVGPSSDGRIKPDLAAQGLNTVVGLSSGLISVNSGTSFSCPLTAGLAAGIWQAFPSLTNSQMALVLKKSASQYNHPDNQLGFGIPNYLNAKQYILDSIFYNAIQLSAQFSLFPNPFKEGFLNFVISSDYYNQSITFKIYDVLGRQVAEDNFMVTSDFKNETTINAASFKSGIYIVQVYLPDKIIKTKIVVE